MRLARKVMKSDVKQEEVFIHTTLLENMDTTAEIQKAKLGVDTLVRMSSMKDLSTRSMMKFHLIRPDHCFVQESPCSILLSTGKLMNICKMEK